ncbi:hypothetical protein BTUL_0043g00190 [Botrytis tulipae]|uniref:Uncharacterized protein n=1 Tax=Botrytis tulipae TaxID=87230 RepID=A0A4Z1ESE8_9HELO|nr:hypothetical protein BTUL_0043g00190 [Botrytis tulipae]
MLTLTASHLAQKRWPSIKDSDLQSTEVAWVLHPLAHFIINTSKLYHTSKYQPGTTQTEGTQHSDTAATRAGISTA